MSWSKQQREQWAQDKARRKKQPDTAAVKGQQPCRFCGWRNKNCDASACLLPRCVYYDSILARRYKF